MKWREATAAAKRRLAANPEIQATAARDAEYLLFHQLGVNRATLLAYPERALSFKELTAYEQAVSRRLAHEPVQYITGEQEFFGLMLRVTPAVLIPRPETELLVEAVLDRFPADRPLRILDVGTGSGAIAVALAAHLPEARITAVDTSAAALSVAEGNVRAHGLEGRIDLQVSDLLDAVADQTFDCIVSNPPYVPLADRATLHPQVRDFEPAGALFAGEAGLDVYLRLIPAASAALVPGGLLALEIGHGQREAICKLLAGWQSVSFQDDLQGILRVVLVKRSFS